MIKASELRIGNYLTIGDGAFQCALADLKRMSDLHKPIQLTEEWLVKFGFEYQPCGISGADMWQGLGFWSRECAGGYITLRGDKHPAKYGLRVSGFINSRIQNVHEIQNYFHSISGEELTIEPKNAQKRAVKQ